MEHSYRRIIMITLWKTRKNYKTNEFVCIYAIFSDVYVKENPCVPSPCGPNSHCQSQNGQAICACVQGYLGNPPTCRPECTVNSDCPMNEACGNLKCRNPCEGTCGVNAKCRVVNHNPICTCPTDYIGNPFTRCDLRRKEFFDFFFIINN